MQNFYIKAVIISFFSVFSILNLRAQDVGVTSILLPSDLSCGSSSMVIKVIVYNYGTSSVTNIPVATVSPGNSSYSLKDTLRKTIAAGNQDTLLFKSTINTLSGNVFILKAYTNLSSDTKRSNDTLAQKLTVMAYPNSPTVTNGYSCGSGPVKIKAVSSAKGSRTVWYTTSTSTKSFAKGDSISPVLSTTTNYFAESVQGTGYDSLLTLLSAGNGQTGNMFDVTIYQTLYIDSFDVSPSSSGTDTAEFYYKSGTYSGYNSSASAWTFVGKSPIYSKSGGTGSRARAKFGRVKLVAGNSYGFYIRLKSTNILNYTNGASTDSFYNGIMTAHAGIGIAGLFSTSTFSYRKWNGVIYYSTPSCSSSRVTVTATVVTPVKGLKLSKNATSKGSFNLGTAANPDEICVGDSLKYNLSVPTNYTNADYGTKWKVSYTMKTAKGTSTSNFTTISPSSSVTGLFAFEPQTANGDSTYILTVTASNLVSGCDSTFSRYIHVNQAASAQFTALDVCYALPINITNSSTPSGKLNFVWKFGNGDSSTATAPAYVYKAVGAYTISLTASNAACKSTLSKTINVLNSPSGSTIIKSTPFFGVFNNGTALSPDYICTGDTNTYQLTPPKGYTNSNFGTKWGISSMTFATASGTTISDTIARPPSGSNNAYFKFFPSKYGDSVFILTITGGCLGKVNTITNNSTPSGKLSYKWSFGNGDVSTAAAPYYAYKTAGTYTVMLTVSNGPCTSTATQSISVYQTPYGSNFFKGTPFSGQFNTGDVFDPDNLCTGDTNAYQIPSPKGFSNSDYGTKWIITGMSFSTIFGSKTTDTIFKKPTPTRNALFSFFPSAKFTDSVFVLKFSMRTLPGNCDTFMYRYIHVRVRPTALFSKVNACLGSPVQFTDLSSIKISSITSWAWDFGDGTKSTAQNPSHSYSTPGTYNVTLTPYSDAGCGTIYSSKATQYPNPVAKFGVFPGCNNTVTVFKDSSTISTGSINIWKWNLGDGTVTGTQNPTNTYVKSGPYNVKLVAYSAFGCKDSLTKKIRVLPKPVAKFSFLNSCVGSVIYFSNISTDSVPGSKYIWDMGDGTVTTTVVPTHKYTKNGTYNVSLKVISKNGCTDSTAQPITPYVKPVVNLFVSPGCTNQYTIFSDSSHSASGSIFEWSFGDGTTVLGKLAANSHIYKKAGVYTVVLTITNTGGCIDSQKKSVTVIDVPEAGFTAPEVCIGKSAVFTNTSAGPAPLHYVWNFGDGSPADTTLSPIHNFKFPGAFHVKVSATNRYGCTDSFDNTFIVNQLPVAPAWIRDQKGYTVTFKPTDTTLASYKWYFGTPTNDSSSKMKPTFTYSVGDKRYAVKLVVVSNAGCSAFRIDSIGMGKYGIEEPFNTLDGVSIYPNPFEGKTTISYSLIACSKVIIRVFDIQGRQVAQLKDGIYYQGAYTDVFDASKYNAPGGVYFVKMYVDNKYFTSKIMNLR
jgi:PKD repeat protein